MKNKGVDGQPTITRLVASHADVTPHRDWLYGGASTRETGSTPPSGRPARAAPVTINDDHRATVGDPAAAAVVVTLRTVQRSR